MTMKKLKIRVYTDGACSGNPGPGGWAALLLIKSDKGKNRVTIKGGEKHTTNNRMELQAVIKALSFIQKNMKDYECQVRVFSDSSYVVNSINNFHLFNWERNGWKTSRDSDVINKDLWVKMIKLIGDNKPEFQKVKGHSGDKFNDHVDRAAVEECTKYKSLLESL